MKITPKYPIAFMAAACAMCVSGSSLRASDTDSIIESSAKESHVFTTHLAEDSINIASKDGAVTLTGTVAQGSHRSLAQDTVESLPNVKSVDNRLEVKGEDHAEHSDGWLGVKVKTALLFHRNVRATKTGVDVKDGVVTLSGEASSLAQKELTAEYAADVEGVKDVKNEMTVAAAPEPTERSASQRIDDASITAQVKWSLMAHRSTSSMKTGVETKEGVVTLTGIAKNEAEKSLVTKLVNDIDGVSSVINNMTIASPPIAKN